mmetsp:Transcript_35043/g.80682  ORF Transcript_35043/g.80682 Transcript_35043/m.80682 type:complete len:248 (-) Transcript_35043:55-798(-)
MWAVRVRDVQPETEDSAKECWDKIFEQLDATKREAAVDPVGKLRASRGPQSAGGRSFRPNAPGLHEPATPCNRPKAEPARPASSRQRRQRKPEVGNRYRPKKDKVLETGFRLAVGHADLFDPSSGVLHPKNFGTWDKNRCHLPERLWPCQGAIATLYDIQRRDKVDWRRGMPRGQDFGMALADVGSGTAAEAFIAKYVRKQRATGQATNWDREENSSPALHDDSLHRGKRATVRWLGGRPVNLEFGV